MTKFEVGDNVYYYRWRYLNQACNSKVLAVMPKRIWHIQQRYMVSYQVGFPAVAKESDLVKTNDHE